ncbi:ABC transporter permease [Faecalimonas umbilicata]|nr:ABC transporter permease [Faecalimonas umbilicata]
MDIHRLLHSKSTWIMICFVIGLAVFSVTMTNSDIEFMKDDPAAVTETMEERPVGIYVEAQPEWVNGTIEIGSVVSVEMRSQLLAILCVIFAAIFTNADYKNGYIKNIAGQFPRREQLVASKFIVIAFQVLVMVIVFTISIVVSGYVMWGSDFYLGSVTELFQYLGVQYLLHLGIAAVMMLLCTLTYSTAFSMTSGILLCSGLAVPIYSLINKAINGLKTGLEFDINKYILDGNITMLLYDSTSEVMVRGVAVGVAFAIVSLFISTIIVKKRDIR